MMSRSTYFKGLVWLVAINILMSILHYVDNIMYFEHHPEPKWLNADLVDYFWFFMTPFSLIGLYLFYKNKYTMGFIAIVLYCLMSLLVLGHYNYTPFFEISFKIHLFIWLEAISAFVLLIYIFSYTHFIKKVSDEQIC